MQRCAGGVPLRRNRQHIRPAHKHWRAGDFVDSDELLNTECYEGDQLDDPREMVGSEPSPRSTATTQTREMVGSEPSPSPSHNIEPRQTCGRSTEGPLVDCPRRSSRARSRPDFYQAGS